MEKLQPTLRFTEFKGDWSSCRLEQISNGIFSGKSINKLDFGLYPFYGSTGIIGYSNSFDYSDEVLLIARVGANAGNVYRVNGKYSVSDNTLILKINNEHYLDFVYFQLVKKKLNKLIFGSGQPLVTGGDLKKFMISIPSLPEQQKIALFLTTVDDKISNLKQKVSLLEKYKKGVMQQIFSQQIRFKDENGNDYLDWEYLNGNLIFDSITDKNHNSDLPILAITQEFGAIPRDLIDYNVSVTDKSIDSYKVVEIGDFIISLRSFQGGIEYSNYRGICSPAYIILRSKLKIEKIFFKYYLKTDNYIKSLNKNLEGIRDGKMISYKYFSEIKLPFPSFEEQTKIAEFLSGIDSKIETTKLQLSKMEVWKKGLLQGMFC